MSSSARVLSSMLVLFAAGCSGGSSVAVDAAVLADTAVDVAPDVASADTWDNFAEDFFATYCVDCHAGSPSGRDYRTIDDVLRDQALIRCGVSATTLNDCDENAPSPRQFPIGSGAHPSDVARSRLVQWIDDGAMH